MYAPSIKREHKVRRTSGFSYRITLVHHSTPCKENEDKIKNKIKSSREREKKMKIQAIYSIAQCGLNGKRKIEVKNVWRKRKMCKNKIKATNTHKHSCTKRRKSTKIIMIIKMEKKTSTKKSELMEDTTAKQRVV